MQIITNDINCMSNICCFFSAGNEKVGVTHWLVLTRDNGALEVSGCGMFYSGCGMYYRKRINLTSKNFVFQVIQKVEIHLE